MTKRMVGRVSAALMAAPLVLQGGSAWAAGAQPGMILDLGQVLSAAEAGTAAGSAAAAGSATAGGAAGMIAVGGLIAAGGIALAVGIGSDDDGTSTSSGTTDPSASGSGGGSADPDTSQEEDPAGTGDEDDPVGFATRTHTQALPTGALGNGLFLAHGYDPRYSFGVLSGGAVDHSDLVDPGVLANPFVGSTGNATMALVSTHVAPGVQLRAGNWIGGGEAGVVSEVAFNGAGQWGVRFGGARQDDAFGTLDTAASLFAGVSYQLDLTPKMALVASAHYGVAGMDATEAGSARLSGESYGLGLVGSDLLDARDRAGVVVGQPLRFDGGASYDLPEDRHIEVQGFYAKDLGDDRQIRLGAAWQDGGANGGLSLGARYAISFGLAH